MKRNRYTILQHILTICLVFIYSQPSTAAGLFRLKATTPKELIEEIYNNVLIGNDHLADIDVYMSSGLKSDYKKSLKFSKKGGKCDIPRILSNGIFSGKLKGFSVDQIRNDAWSADVKVTLNTGFKDLSPSNELKKFDPKVYEVISINLVRRFVDWKIDNIKSSTPEIQNISNIPTYKVNDLRQMLKTCR